MFTDEELRQYEYAQDIRYWYGLGPGTDLEQTMMMPYLNALVGLLQEGPGINGTAADGGSFTLPDLLVSFLNDGQLVELISATGVFDDQPELSGTNITDSLFIASHFVTMRGTVALERLNCLVGGSSSNGTSSNGTTLLARNNDLHPRVGNTTSSTNATYVRIKLNDAVYTLPSCKDGPGQSCLLSDYATYISDKYASEGNWVEKCNVTTADAPTTVQGASFYTDLTSPWLQQLPPY